MYKIKKKLSASNNNFSEKEINKQANLINIFCIDAVAKGHHIVFLILNLESSPRFLTVEKASSQKTHIAFSLFKNLILVAFASFFLVFSPKIFFILNFTFTADNFGALNNYFLWTDLVTNFAPVDLPTLLLFSFWYCKMDRNFF